MPMVNLGSTFNLFGHMFLKLEDNLLPEPLGPEMPPLKFAGLVPKQWDSVALEMRKGLLLTVCFLQEKKKD